MPTPLPGRILPLGPDTFRALKHRNFRLYWIGQLVSLTGSWMQSVAQGWLVLRLTDSPLALGIVGFCAFVPVLLFTLVGGAAADRLPRRTALLWTQALAMVQATVLTGITWLGVVEPWHVAVLAFGLGTVNAFDIPIRQTFLLELVGREDLPNAIALNAMAFNGARLVGPAIAGLLLAAFGEKVCFLLNALSFLAVLLGILMMRVKANPASPGEESWLTGIRQGIAYAWGTPPVRAILLAVAVSSVFGMSYSVLMPAIARDVIGGGQRTLGFLMGAAGAGAVIGALAVAGRRSTRHAAGIVAVSMAVFGASLVVFSFSRNFWVSAVLLHAVGASVIVQMATSNAFLQLVAPPVLRGRIVSIYTLMFLGMAPFGALLSGLVAKLAGTPAAVGLGGGVCLVVALGFARAKPGFRAAGATQE